MGSRASSLLREEDIEEIKKETGCKLKAKLVHFNPNDCITLTEVMSRALTHRLHNTYY